MRLRKKENNELRDLNDQISQNSELLKRYTDYSTRLERMTMDKHYSLL